MPPIVRPHLGRALPSLPEVDTPALVADSATLERNLRAAAETAAAAGLALRPHTKTHRSVAIARRQLEFGAVGITAAKPQEALVYWEAGIRDIFLAYPPVGAAKLRTLRPIVADNALMVGLDDLTTATELGRMAAGLGTSVPVLFEVDVGMHRAGKQWGRPAAHEATEVAQVPGITLAGVFTHEGHAHDCPPDQIPALARECAVRLATTAGLIREAGHDCPIVSTGSSLTVRHIDATMGVTEARPGVYIYNDVRTVRSDAATWRDCALTVLSTVVSRPDPTRAVIDAGAKTLTPAHDDLWDYGALPEYPGARLHRLSEEHGMIVFEQPTRVPAIGDRVHVVPVRAGLAVNLQQDVNLIEDGDLVDTIPTDALFCSR